MIWILSEVSRSATRSWCRAIPSTRHSPLASFSSLACWAIASSSPGRGGRPLSYSKRATAWGDDAASVMIPGIEASNTDISHERNERERAE